MSREPFSYVLSQDDEDAHNEDLLIHAFYDSLTRAAAQWYTKLRKDQIRTWRDLARAFFGRYKYMLEIVPDRLTLQSMKKGIRGRL